MTPTRTRAPSPVTVVMLALLALAVLGAAWIGVRGFLAAGHLRAAQTIAEAVPDEFASTPESLSQTIASLQRETAAARDLTSDIVWGAGESLPWVGPQLRAVGALSSAADTLAERALPALADVLTPEALTAFAPRDGALPLDALAPIAAAAPAAVAGLDQARAEIAAADSPAVVRPLREFVSAADEQVTAISGVVEALDNAARLLPPMMGATERRSYLLVFQNNAELRSLGGMPGALARVDAEAGRLSLAGQFSAGDFRVDEPVGMLTAEEKALFDGPERVISATTEITDFTVAGPLLLDYWRTTQGSELDGVISLDPVALSYLLRATGPLTMPDGSTLSADNAVARLLKEPYLTLDPVAQNAYFAAATATVFGALTTGDYDPRALITALAQAGSERRLLLHSAHDEEQAILATTSLAGGLPADDAFGVYLNDGTGSKMDYYLDVTAAVETGPGAWDLVLSFASSAPADVATYPASVTGGGGYGVPAGVTRTVAYIYLPAGSTLRTTDAAAVSGWAQLSHKGRIVLAGALDLAPGETKTATISVTATRDSAVLPEVIMTPQVR